MKEIIPKLIPKLYAFPSFTQKKTMNERDKQDQSTIDICPLREVEKSEM